MEVETITNKKNIVFFTYGSSLPRILKFTQAGWDSQFVLRVEDLISKFENNEELPGDYIEKAVDARGRTSSRNKQKSLSRAIFYWDNPSPMPSYIIPA